MRCKSGFDAHVIRKVGAFARFRGRFSSYCTGLNLALCMLGEGAQAARPMVAEGARIVDAKACQLGNWGKGNRGSTEYRALPACNFTGNLELTLDGARTREVGEIRATDVQLLGKTLFRPLETSDWGIGLVAGMVRHPQAGARRQDWHTYVPANLSFRDGAVVVPTNAGCLREGGASEDRLTWGVGSEVGLAEKTWPIAETFGQSPGRPSHQPGLRPGLAADRVQLDATCGNRKGSGRGERWFSIGLRLLSVPFLS